MPIKASPTPGPGLLERRGPKLPAAEVARLAGRADERCSRTYVMCGRVLALRCDSAAYAASFERALRHMRCDGPPAGAPRSELTFLTAAAGPGGFPALLDPARGRGRIFESEAVEPTQLFFTLAFLEDGMFPLDAHAVLHASVVESGGAVTALVGLTHSGKTTAALALALEPGLSFLSDEFCAIRLADGRVDPFPRALGLRRPTRRLLGERGALPAAIVDAAEDELALDPLEVRGLTIGRGGSVRNVVIVGGGAADAAPGTTRDLDVEFVSERLLADLRAIAGVRSIAVRPDVVAAGRALRVEVEPGARVTEALIGVCRERHGMQLVGILPPGARRPDFRAPPRLVPLPPLAALTELLRHLANRAALGERPGCHSLGGLLDLLAGVLGGARFFGLRPGPLEETTRLLRERVIEA